MPQSISHPVTWPALFANALADAAFPPEKFRLAGEPPPAVSGALADELHFGLVEVIGNYWKFSDAPAAGLHAEIQLTPGEGPRLRLHAPGPALHPDTIALLLKSTNT